MLNLKFVNKIASRDRYNEVIFCKQKEFKSNSVKQISKSVFSNKLFLEQSFLKKDYHDKSYIFVNCTKLKISLDFLALSAAFLAAASSFPSSSAF